VRSNCVLQSRRDGVRVAQDGSPGLTLGNRIPVPRGTAEGVPHRYAWISFTDKWKKLVAPHETEG
jgi:hypothetical protein